MINHILLPGIDFSELQLIPPHKEWLTEWLQDNESDVENGRVSSSLCLQSVLSEILLYGKCKTDWQGIIQAYLKTNSGKPLAYSNEFGKRLHKFNQWEQSPVHAIHSHWWIEKFNGAKQKDLKAYGDMIQELIQPSGWIYNPKVSPTNTRTRMRSELMMSIAMGLEILSFAGSLSDRRKIFESVLSSMPMTGYLSAEYFRLRSLKFLDSIKLAPHSLADVMTTCEAGEGYCDFSVESKVDDYMGTAKRVTRDKAIQSPISSLHANYVAVFCGEKVQNSVQSRLHNFGQHLLSEPFDIPAFRMRDIDVPFGTDLSPCEIIGASHIVSIGKD